MSVRPRDPGRRGEGAQEPDLLEVRRPLRQQRPGQAPEHGPQRPRSRAAARACRSASPPRATTSSSKVQGNQAYEVGKGTVAKLNQQLASQTARPARRACPSSGSIRCQLAHRRQERGRLHRGAARRQPRLGHARRVEGARRPQPARPARAGGRTLRCLQAAAAQRKRPEGPDREGDEEPADRRVRGQERQHGAPRGHHPRAHDAQGPAVEVQRRDRRHAPGLDRARQRGHAQAGQVAPTGAKPISELGGQLNALGGSQLGRAAGSGSGSGSSSGSGSAPRPARSTRSTPSAKQFQDYADCIQKAGGNNAAALQKCADLLK